MNIYDGHFGTVNWLCKSTVLVCVVEMLKVKAAEGHLKYVLNIYYHA